MDRNKFRVWHKARGEWLDKMVINGNGKLYQVLGHGNRNHYSKDEIDLEHCTGTKDIAENLIFDGDLLADEAVDDWQLYKVEWCDDRCGFQCLVYMGDCEFEWDGDFGIHEEVDPRELRIIGNVHENKELLTKS